VKPLILVTNDDGIFSPGLKAAAEAALPLGELLIVAPRRQQTGMSRSLPSGEGIGIIEAHQLEIGGSLHPAYSVEGSPALAVIYAIFEIAPRKPDLCISGINYGENIGMTITISGTIGAALEANVGGIPAIAVSRQADLHMHRANTGNYGELDWDIPKHFTAYFADYVLREKLPAGVALLNINIPAEASRQSEIRQTVQSQQAYIYFMGEGRSENGWLKLGTVVQRETLEPDSDIQAFAFDQVVSVTPLTGNLTAKAELKIEN
jgi:5'-nucleotidase